jgi:hypothetical protein
MCRIIANLLAELPKPSLEGMHHKEKEPYQAQTASYRFEKI